MAHSLDSGHVMWLMLKMFWVHNHLEQNNMKRPDWRIVMLCMIIWTNLQRWLVELFYDTHRMKAVPTQGSQVAMSQLTAASATALNG